MKQIRVFITRAELESSENSESIRRGISMVEKQINAKVSIFFFLQLSVSTDKMLCCYLSTKYSVQIILRIAACKSPLSPNG